MARREEAQRKIDVQGRMLPHSIEAEQSILGCAMIDDVAAIYMLEILTKECFYTESHQTIFEAMNFIKMGRARIDVVTLTNQLELEGNLQLAGGLQYINTISNYVPSSANYRNYVDIVKNKYILRRLVASCSTTIEGAFNNQDSNELLNAAEMEIYAIAKTQERGKLVPIADVLPAVIQKIKDLEDPNNHVGIPTGFIGLNNILHGLQRSDLVLIAARPSVGKTAFGMNIITNVALAEGPRDEHGKSRKYRCAVFSLEMTKEQLAQRILCSVAGVSMSKISKGETDKNDWKKLMQGRQILSEAQIFIDDTSLIKPTQLMDKCLRLKNAGGLDVVMIDYLQLMTSDNTRVESRQNQVSEITRFLKIMAKELNVPILLLSQLSRKVEERQDKTPMLSDLRESGAIEQDADIVMFIHRDLAKEIDNPTDKVSIIISKHRNGSLGRVPLKWNGECVRFLDDEEFLPAQHSIQAAAPPPERERFSGIPDENEEPVSVASEYFNPDGSPDIPMDDDGDDDDYTDDRAKSDEEAVEELF